LNVNINLKDRELIKALKSLFMIIKKKNEIVMKFWFFKYAWPSYMADYILLDAVKTFNLIIRDLKPIHEKLLANMLR